MTVLGCCSLTLQMSNVISFRPVHVLVVLLLVTWSHKVILIWSILKINSGSICVCDSQEALRQPWFRDVFLTL